MLSTRTVNIVVAVTVAAVVATAAWATPGSAFSTTPLVQSTAAVRIDVKTHPHTLNDVQVQSVVGQPGGYSGWHSHVGYGIVAVRAGTATIYDGDDPTCSPRYVSAGEVFIEEPGHVHFVRNEGTVRVRGLRHVHPAGRCAFEDRRPSPGNCPF